MDKTELNQLIRDTFDSGVSDPYDVAQRVMTCLVPGDHEEVLRAVLPRYTQLMAGRQRKSADTLAKPIFVPSVGWKDMSTLTSEECREVALEYRKLADQNLSMALEFEEWATRLETNMKHTLGELAEFKEYMSLRTKEGMARAKAAGRHVGRPKPSPELVERVKIMRQTMTLRRVAETLNAEGIRTTSGSLWTLNGVAKFLGK